MIYIIIDTKEIVYIEVNPFLCMSRRLSDGGRISQKWSKLCEFIKPDLGAWSLLAGELFFGAIALYISFSGPNYSPKRDFTEIEAPRDLYSGPIAYDPPQRQR